jgi:hypothetical protein
VGADHSFYVALSEFSDPDAAALDYESNEDLDDTFRRDVLGLRFYSLRFNNLCAVKRVVFDLVTRLNVLGMDSWIDTDYGWVIRGAEAVARMNRDPSWDWRKPAPGSARS